MDWDGVIFITDLHVLALSRQVPQRDSRVCPPWYLLSASSVLTFLCFSFRRRISRPIVSIMKSFRYNLSSKSYVDSLTWSLTIWPLDFFTSIGELFRLRSCFSQPLFEWLEIWLPFPSPPYTRRVMSWQIDQLQVWEEWDEFSHRQDQLWGDKSL